MRGARASRRSRRSAKTRFFFLRDISKNRVGFYLFVTSIFLLVVFISYRFINNILMNSDYFAIKDVEISITGRNPLSPETIEGVLNLGKGENIFRIDIRSLRDQILIKYPSIKNVTVFRYLPNKLFIKIVPRIPIAQISVGNNYCLIDKEGMILPRMIYLMLENLPVVIGFNPTVIVKNRGKVYKTELMERVLSLLKAVDKTGFYSEHQLHTIDVADRKNISLVIEGGIEVRIGAEDFENRLRTLIKTLNERFDKRHIRYIDLRFSDVIIGPK